MNPLADDEKRMLALIASRIKLRRKFLGYTQSDCAAELGISLQQFQKYDAGKNWIGVLHLVQLTTFLKVSLGFFFELEAIEDQGECEGTRHLQLLKAYEVAAPAVKERVDGLLGIKRGERSPHSGNSHPGPRFQVADALGGAKVPSRRATGGSRGRNVGGPPSMPPVWEPADIDKAVEGNVESTVP